MLVLVLATMPVWVPLVVQPLCIGFENSQQADDIEMCSGGWDDVDEGHACCAGTTDECTIAVDGTELAICLMQQGTCAMNPNVKVRVTAIMWTVPCRAMILDNASADVGFDRYG